MKKIGKLIVIEGGDASGKSSAIKQLKKTLKGERICYTKEPRGTQFGEKIVDALFKVKHDEFTALLIMLAARVAHMNEVILPAILSGYTVICDRYDASTYAYQVYGRRNSTIKKIFQLSRQVLSQQVAPERYIFLDVEPRIVMQRLRARGKKRSGYDLRPLSFHAGVRKGYKEFLRGVPHVIVDAGGTMEKKNSEVLAAVRNVMKI